MWDYLPTTTRLSQGCRSTLRHLSPQPPCPARSAGAGSFVSATRCDFKPRLNRPTRLGFHFGTSRSMTQLTPARLSRGGVFHTLFHTHERPSAKSEITVGPIITFVRETPDGGSGGVCGAPGPASAVLEKLN
jgi:hypothetical protein